MKHKKILYSAVSTMLVFSMIQAHNGLSQIFAEDGDATVQIMETTVSEDTIKDNIDEIKIPTELTEETPKEETTENVNAQSEQEPIDEAETITQEAVIEQHANEATQEDIAEQQVNEATQEDIAEQHPNEIVPMVQVKSVKNTEPFYDGYVVVQAINDAINRGEKYINLGTIEKLNDYDTIAITGPVFLNGLDDFTIDGGGKNYYVATEHGIYRHFMCIDSNITLQNMNLISGENRQGGGILAKDSQVRLIDTKLQDLKYMKNSMEGELSIFDPDIYLQLTYAGAIVGLDSNISLIGSSSMENCGLEEGFIKEKYDFIQTNPHVQNKTMGGNLLIIGGSLHVGDDVKITNDPSHMYANGGAIYADNAKSIVIDGNAYIQGHSQGFGGAIYALDVPEVIIGGSATIADSHAVRGAAIYAQDVDNLVVQDNARVANNTANLSGGGIHADYSNIKILGNAQVSGNKIEKNEALDYDIVEFLTDNDERENSNQYIGGGIYAEDVEQFLMDEQAAIYDNQAEMGGGIALVNSGLKTTGQVELYDNVAAHSGGAIMVIDEDDMDIQPIEINGAKIYNNVAGNSDYGMGGAIFLRNIAYQYLTLDHVAFSNNRAQKAISWRLDTNPKEGSISATHINNIKNTVYTSPLTNAYNNYDIYFDYLEYEVRDAAIQHIIFNTPEDLEQGQNGYLYEEEVVSGLQGENLSGLEKESIEYNGWKYTPIKQYIFPIPAAEIVPAMTNVRNTIPTFEIHYLKSMYTVSFDSNGGTPVANQVIPAGELATKPENVVKDGYRLMHWDFNGEVWDFQKTITENIALVAIWKKEHIVTFETGDNNNLIEKQIVLDGQTIQEPKTIGMNGYEFGGWLYNGTLWNFQTPVTSDMVLVARWNRMVHVDFDVNGGTPDIDSQVFPAYEKVAMPQKVTKEGYVFAGWLNKGELWNFDDQVVENMSLVADWKKEVTVHFDTNGGTPSVESQKILENEKVKEPVGVTKEGYVLAGWLHEGQQWDFSKEVEKDMTLVADWKKEITVNFDTNGGTPRVQAQKILVNQKATEPIGVTRDGYTLTGWFLNETRWDFSTEIQNDMTLVAIWKVTDEGDKDNEEKNEPEVIVKPTPTPSQEPEPSETIEVQEVKPPLSVITVPLSKNEYVVYDEDNVPLGKIILEDGENIDEISLEEIMDRLIPLGIVDFVKVKMNPSTGDMANNHNWMLWLLVGGIIVVIKQAYQKLREQ